MNPRTRPFSLLGASVLAFAGSALAAPGDLDPGFNAGSGYLALTGGTQPRAEGLCIDAQQRIVLSAGRINPDGNSQGYLIRVSSAGVADAGFAPGLWRAVGVPSAAQQQSSVLCANSQYAVVTAAGTGGQPIQARLDLVPYTGTAQSSTLLTGTTLHSGRIPLAATINGWLSGGAIASGAALQDWYGSNAPLVLTSTWPGPTGSSSQYTEAVHQPLGDTWAVGRRLNAAGNFQTFVSKFTSNGQPHPGFAGGTAFVWDTSQDDYGQRIVRSAFNGMLYVGMTEQSGSGNSLQQQVRILRLQANGSIDPTFSSFGTGLVIPNAALGDLAEDNQGRLVVAGTGADGSTGAFVVRFHAQGSIDTSFGMRHYGFGSNVAIFTGVAFDALGRIVLSGSRQEAQRGGGTVPAAAIVARLQP